MGQGDAHRLARDGAEHGLGLAGERGRRHSDPRVPLVAAVFPVAAAAAGDVVEAPATSSTAVTYFAIL